MSRLNDRERVEVLQKQEIPRFLYKFRAAPIESKSTRDIILNSSLWLSSPADFNDPFDAKAKLIVDSTAQERRKRFDEILRRESLGWSQRKELLPRLVGKPLTEIAKIAEARFLQNSHATGVCSLAGDPLNMLMLSHYASDHRGLCFQFDVARDPGKFVVNFRVEYSDEYPVVNWFKDFTKNLN